MLIDGKRKPLNRLDKCEVCGAYRLNHRLYREAWDKPPTTVAPPCKETNHA